MKGGNVAISASYILISEKHSQGSDPGTIVLLIPTLAPEGEGPVLLSGSSADDRLSKIGLHVDEICFMFLKRFIKTRLGLFAEIPKSLGTMWCCGAGSAGTLGRWRLPQRIRKLG
jgi:hypothetical protein